ncbi:MAG: porin [Rubrivivax sp.]|nr:porin [Rubrivivax sp.]
MSLAPVAGAQNAVVLYGNVDAGVAVLRNDAPGGGTLKALASGMNSASRWGMRGSEDLGGGLSAIFQIEAGIDLDVGAAKPFAGNPGTATPTLPNGTTGTGFNRRSYVGLESKSWGGLRLGRDYTAIYYSLVDADVMRLGMFGNLQQIIAPGGGSERFARASNAIFYNSPRVAGVVGRAFYSLGSEGSGGPGALPKDANRFFGVEADYASGSLFVTASYQQLAFPVVAGAAFTGATADRKDALVAAKYSFGNYAVGTGYWKMGSPQSVTDTWLGASAAFGLNTFFVQVQRLRQDNPAGEARRGTVLALAYTYTLSRRTALYASYGQTNNNATGAFGVTSSDFALAAGGAGADPSALGFGIRHNF